MTEEPPEWAKEIGRKMPGVAEIDAEIAALKKRDDDIEMEIYELEKKLLASKLSEKKE